MFTFTLSKTQRIKTLLVCNGFSYTIDKTNNDKTYWKCEYARTVKCKGRVHTNNINTIMLHENNNHNHPGMLYQVKYDYSKKKFVIVLLIIMKQHKLLLIIV